MNGYALVRASGNGYELPNFVITLDALKTKFDAKA
jgi:hypothetical protein